MSKTKTRGNTSEFIFNMVNTYLVKGASLVIGFFTTPAYMEYFSDKRVLGVWFTIISVLTWILYFDFGIGNGLRNRVTETLVAKETVKTKIYISSAYIFIIAVALVFSVIIFNLTSYVNWNGFFNIDETSIDSHDLRTAVNLVLLSILLQLVLRLITSLMYAMQLAFVQNLLAMSTNVILLIYTVICNRFGLNNNIINLAVVYLFAANIPLIITTIYAFSTILKEVRPNITFFNKYYALDTFKIGSAFLLLQFCALIINNTTYYLVSRLCGSAEVVEYNIYYKVFSLIDTFVVLGTTAVWSAVTKALAQKKIDWVMKLTYFLYGAATVVFLLQFAAFPLFQPFFDLWLGDKTIKVQYPALITFSITCGISSWSYITASICNGMGELKLQSVLMVLGAALMVPIALIGSKITGNYIGVELAHGLALLPHCIIQTAWLLRQLRFRMKYLAEAS